MAANGAQVYAPVLAAVNVMQSNVNREQKRQATESLDKFQKTPEAWTTSFAILQAPDVAIEGKLFAVVTLKGKIVYDLHQLPREQVPPLRDSLVSLLSAYRAGPKPIRTQLSVCLADLAIQMTEWKSVVSDVVSTLGGDPESIPCALEFLHVLPEEVTEGRKINLTEDELLERTKELLEDNAQNVLALLAQYAQSSATAARNPQLLECITSWSREVPLTDIVNTPLVDTVFNALSGEDEAFNAAVECLGALFRETQDVDGNEESIQKLYPRVVALAPKIVVAAESEDAEALKGIARVFAEAGEAWVLLVARHPQQFRSLIEAILEIAVRDRDRDAISMTFNFWYELKQYLTLDKYFDARLLYMDIYSKLVDVMIGHLEYPQPEGGDEKDLFEGDREQEEKFREFRHQMGDVLKDCCEIIGVTECLQKSYNLIDNWVVTYGSQAVDGRVPHWQKLEAPLFSMRAMGRMVPVEENIMLPALMRLIVNIPDHEKVRFQVVMALGRYTEWTSHHPETLEPQLNFIITAFGHPSKEVLRAAALSLKFFCNDCADLLKDHIAQLQQFYTNVLDKLPISSQEEITDGVASVLAKLPASQTYEYLKLFCNPVMGSLVTMAEAAADEKSKLALADKLQLLTIIVQWVQPQVQIREEHPAVKYCKEIFPVLSAIAQRFSDFAPILERVCRCWRYMVLSYRTAMAPLLPDLATQLSSGFQASRQGCFLWATDSIVREFSEGTEGVDQNTTTAVFHFFEAQAKTFLRALNDLPPEELPDVIEDFYRLCVDILLFHSQKAIFSELMSHIISASCTALTLLKEEPLMAVLHFLRDLLAYGLDSAPSSSFGTGPQRNAPEVQAHVKQLLGAHGDVLVQRIMTGMMYSFPGECFPDASGVVLGMFQLEPAQTAAWVTNTVGMLPPGSISVQEQERLLNNINQRIQSGEIRKIRMLLQDFTNSYRRRNVAPREGLGRLEATKFRFAG